MISREIALASHASNEQSSGEFAAKSAHWANVRASIVAAAGECPVELQGTAVDTTPADATTRAATGSEA